MHIPHQSSNQTDYPAACYAAEILLVHNAVVQTVWPEVAKALLAAGVKLRCDPSTLSAIQPLTSQHSSQIQPATQEDFDTEFLSPTLAVCSTPSLSDAIKFINAHSSHHTDTIITESEENGSTFCRAVDSAGTFINASTRFADGFRYGFGTEVGISTGRTHARGPVGLEGLMIYKYMLKSKSQKGHTAGEFGTGSDKKQFKHRDLDASSVPFLL